MTESRPTILVIDDEPMIRRSLVRALELEGYSVSEARSADEGIALLRRESPGLIVTDSAKPDAANGISVIAEAKEALPDVPIIAISGGRANLERAAAAGADHTFSKPFRLDEFLGIVAKLLGQT